MNKICPHCGKVSNEESPRFCSGCGARMDGSIPVGYRGYNAPVGEQKSQMIAGFCSGLLPGLGQVYNGYTAKGFAIFLLFLAGLVFFLVPGIMIWIYAVYDAYSVAGKMNAGEIPFRVTRTFHLVLFVVFAIVIISIAILIIVSIVAAVLSQFESPGNGNIDQLFSNSGLF
jgi:hypothetical protein